MVLFLEDFYSNKNTKKYLFKPQTWCYTILIMEKQVLNYRVIIEKETYPDGTLVYTAYVPTLGVTDYGPTIDAVLQSLKDGILLAIESLAKDSEEVPVDHPEETIIVNTQVVLPKKVSLNTT
ncbi:hypothetical protein CO015_05475 [candidate division WWE3 bacterium CG_4_8_14_3_um_filter_42_11]|uniref:HicB-like antitoxin of toxin-antitoxin system domain-containing protein n=1 Tax=candidate division WWE3 bacterium CG_4_8_14_3_um_filter_42_11 TaxID=1975076 RepID=A0A2M8G5E8_UNCKA|nr:MAG: hypothetical protein CO015_05475 [candidate division WWE3 bacterium CG_4_8_14_3_um_filter_42_11]